MREAARKLLDRAASSRKVASSYWNDQIEKIREHAKQEIADAKAKQREAEIAAEKARAAAERAMSEAAQAASEAEELANGRADMEGSVSEALNESRENLERLKNANLAKTVAEAKAASLQAELEEARNEIEAAIDVATESEAALNAARAEIASLRAELGGSESSRAQFASKTSAEISRLRGELSQLSNVAGVFDVVVDYDANHLVSGIEVQFGPDKFHVTAVRDAAGHIIEMKRED